MKIKQTIFVAAMLIAYSSAKAQCPTISNYRDNGGQANSCAGVAAMSANFTGTPYATVPGGSKVGDLVFEWTGSAPSVVPAIDTAWLNGTLLALDPGPATVLVSAGSSHTSRYCFYTPGSMPADNSGDTLTFDFVDPSTGSSVYTCTYALTGSLPAVPPPNITVQPVGDTICSGTDANFSVTATPASSGTLSYQWRKDGINITGATSSSYTASSVATSDTGFYTCVIKESGGGLTVTSNAKLALDPNCKVWVGTTTDWSTGSNWSPSGAPASTDAIHVSSSATAQPAIPLGTVSCQSLTIEESASLTLDSGAVIEIAGSIDNSGTFDATEGTVVLNGSAAQVIEDSTFSGNTVQNLTLDNSAGATLGGTLNVLGAYTPTSGTLTTGGHLVMKSTDTTTCCIATGSSLGGYITGDVTVERYIPGGRRAFRFIGHPFTTSKPLSSLTDDIDITGSADTADSLTITLTNKPSCFWYDVNAGSVLTAGNNPGWTAFDNANNNEWDQYEVIRVFVRGAKGEGLTGGTYTPSATTLDMTGTVNQGTQTVTLTKGASTPFVLAANPFPCAVQMNTVAKGSNIDANFVVWDANQGTRGGYTSVPFASSYILPPYGAFTALVSANTNNTLVFEEADKSLATPVSIFKTTGNQHTVQLRLEDSTIFWDRILVSFDDNADAKRENTDAIKLNNPGLDFFTYSSDDTTLSIDVRPYKDGDVIPLGLTAYKEQRFVIKAADFDVPTGTSLYLHDKFLNKKEKLSKGFEYWFDVTSDTLSQGKRFEINMVGKPTSINAIAQNKGALTLVPNPAHNTVRISFDNAVGNTQLRIVNITGKQVYYNNIGTKESGMIEVSLSNMPSGMYIVELLSDNIRLSEKLIKQ